MKLDDSLIKSSSLVGVATPTEIEKNNTTSKQSKVGSSNPYADKVTFSTQLSKMQAIQSDLKSSEPSFDAQKVAAIRAAIENGTFKIDASKIADGLISSTHGFLIR